VPNLQKRTPTDYGDFAHWETVYSRSIFRGFRILLTVWLLIVFVILL